MQTNNTASNNNSSGNNNSGSVGGAGGQNEKSEVKVKVTHPQIQNPPTPLYNQFPYLATFPAAAAAANSTVAVTTPPNTPTQTAAAAAYYPMYHNGFQLGIAPNTVPPPFTPVHFSTATNAVGTTPPNAAGRRKS